MMDTDREIAVRAILSKWFGGGEWPGPYRARLTPAAREIVNMFPAEQVVDRPEKKGSGNA